jgi:hypothetical protein
LFNVTSRVNASSSGERITPISVIIRQQERRGIMLTLQ